MRRDSHTYDTWHSYETWLEYEISHMRRDSHVRSLIWDLTFIWELSYETSLSYIWDVTCIYGTRLAYMIRFCKFLTSQLATIIWNVTRIWDISQETSLAYETWLSYETLHIRRHSCTYESRLAYMICFCEFLTSQLATMGNSRIDKIIGLFCKRALWKRRYSGKETYNLIDPTNSNMGWLHLVGSIKL